LGFTILGVMAPARVSSAPDERFRPSRNRRIGDLFGPAATTADQDGANRQGRRGVVVGAANTLIADGEWFAYGLTAQIAPVSLVSIPAVAASAWTVTLLRNEITAVNAAVASAWLSTVLVSADADVLGAVLTGTVLVTCGPHLVSAFRSREPAGVSRTTSRTAVADALSWGLYGVAIGNLALGGYGMALLATAILILLRLRTVTTAVPETQDLGVTDLVDVELPERPLEGAERYLDALCRGDDVVRLGEEGLSGHPA
jgi:hypothetical protein